MTTDIKPRNEVVSIAKALAIILMVLVHSGFSEYGSIFIAWFHMPLFFFCSGLCFKEKYIADTWGFVKRKIKGIYWPYIKWSLIFLALHNIFFNFHIYHPEIGASDGGTPMYDSGLFINHAVNILSRMRGHDALLGGFWFLRSLFYSSILTYLAIKYIKNKYVITVLFLSLCFMAMYFGPLSYFMLSDTEFAGCLFFFLGFLCKHVNFKRNILLVIPVVISLAITSFFIIGSMVTLDFYNLLPFLVLAVMGIFMVMLISSYIAASGNLVKTSLVFIGDITFEILLWHFLLFKLVSLILVNVKGLPIDYIAIHPVIPDNLYDLSEFPDYCFSSFWPLYFLIGIIGPILIVRVTKLVKSKLSYYWEK